MRERAELLPAFTVRDRQKFANEKKREVIGTAGKIVPREEGNPCERASVVVFSWRCSSASSFSGHMRLCLSCRCTGMILAGRLMATDEATSLPIALAASPDDPSASK